MLHVGYLSSSCIMLPVGYLLSSGIMLHVGYVYMPCAVNPTLTRNWIGWFDLYWSDLYWFDLYWFELFQYGTMLGHQT